MSKRKVFNNQSSIKERTALSSVFSADKKKEPYSSSPSGAGFLKAVGDLNEIISDLLKELDSREKLILSWRFGLKDSERKTLEAIGQNYGLSKERIRQIQNQAINRLKKISGLNDLIGPVKNNVVSFFEEKSGIAKERLIFENTREPAGLIFVMSQFFREDLERIDSHPKLEIVWKLKSLNLDLVEEVLNEILDIVRQRNVCLKKEDLLERLKNSYLYEKHNLKEKDIFSFMEASREIGENVLGEIGLVYWREIVPRRIADKIYLVFRKEKKPLHFSEITEKINELKFDHRIVYPRAVHNELILDERFILVDRGVYGLKNGISD